MPKAPLLWIAVPSLMAALSMTACIPALQQHAYYVSPFNGSSHTYHPLPLKSDSAHTAVYAQASYFGGPANDNRTDRLRGATASVSVAHHFGIVQAWYGLDGTFGSYKVGKWDTGYSRYYRAMLLPPLHSDQLDSYAGSKFFGGAGFSAGINLVHSWRDVEWRYFGLETSLHTEFGDYRAFRKNLPDSLATVLIRSSFYGTVGDAMEIILRTQQGDWGFRVGGGTTFGKAYEHPQDSLSRRLDLSYGYINAAFHYTYGRYTFYAQTEGSFNGRSSRVGIVYRFGRPRIAEKWRTRARP